MAYEISELENLIVNDILFNQLIINTNKKIIEIELINKKDIKKLKEILSNELDSSEYDLIKLNELYFKIQFNIPVTYYYESDEYESELLDELKYYQTLYDEINSDEYSDEYF